MWVGGTEADEFLVQEGLSSVCIDWSEQVYGIEIMAFQIKM